MIAHHKLFTIICLDYCLNYKPKVAAGQTDAVADVAAAPEKTEFDIELASFGDSKISVIKIVKDVWALGLKEAK